MLKLQIDKKQFRDSLLYKDMTLELKQGELLCLMGPSGCGKTSLLNLIAGLDTDFEGNLDIADGHRVSYMFQDPRLLPWRTVQQNLELVVTGSQHGWSRKQKEQKIAAIPSLLNQLGLQHCSNMYPSQLSLGMARRIALVRCLIVEPQLVLLDEPFVSLDRNNRQAIHHQLRQIRSHYPELSLVMVTHDIDDAITLADRIMLLQLPPNSRPQEFIPNLATEGDSADHSVLQRLQEAISNSSLNDSSN